MGDQQRRDGSLYAVAHLLREACGGRVHEMMKFGGQVGEPMDV